MPPNLADTYGTLHFRNVQTQAFVAANEDRSQTSMVRFLMKDGKTMMVLDKPGTDVALSPAVVFDNNSVSLRTGTNQLQVTAMGTSAGTNGSAPVAEIGSGSTKYRLVVNGNDELEIQKFVNNVYSKTVQVLS